jgi:carboxypeptidase C (cathepsin A)
MKKPSIPLRLFTVPALLLLAAGSAAGQAPEGAPPAEAAAVAPARAPYYFESRAEAHINGEKVRYRAVVEESFIENPGGQKTASIVTTSYFREAVKNAAERPVIFVFNGGPGSAGLWLQMGLMSPRRVDFADDVNPPTVPPYQLTDNAESPLDVADIVIFDPPGTGFSRVLPAGKTEEFYGTQQDAKVTLHFIQGWIRRHNRFNSPRYLVGESYGTIRAAVVAKLMAGGPFGSGSMDAITLNGVVLLGQAMNMGGDSGDISFANILPSLAATAWFHGKVDQNAATLEQHVGKARQFAANEYIQALYAGSRLDATRKQQLAETLAGLTGLSAGMIVSNDLRISTTSFANALLADSGQQVGKYDSRYVLPLSSSGNDPVADDPAMGQYVPGFVAALNLHMRGDLGVEIEEDYLPIEFHKVNGRWDYGRGPGIHVPTNHAEDLAVAMRRNPQLRLFVGTGYYDLVTTVGAAEYTVSHTDFPAARVVMKNYASGHMPYLGEEARKQIAADLRRFVTEDSQP